MENNNIDVYLLSSSTPPVHCAGHPTNVHQDDDKNRSQPGQRGQRSSSAVTVVFIISDYQTHHGQPTSEQ